MSAQTASPAPAPEPAPAADPWLVVIDPQRIFADPASDWASPFFGEAMERIAALAAHVGPERTIVTRWLPTADRATAWGDYFRAWPFADVPASDPLYDLVPAAEGLTAHPLVEEPTFGKWGPALAAAVGAAPGETVDLILTGVSTDCCVIATALAAADAGMRIRVAQDACAPSTSTDGAAAMQVMGLFAPQISIVQTAEILEPGGLEP
ncbi:cysteine hydrolase [Brachybacterium sp. JHP9]|uniref:Cysteine hydrolase n=1 Tax=Brachybacterium equifaecis TaxID=2910770 RepID=A0ABT0R4X2_9MICO|nr:isochorismatase family protein [Brachybacterium equifaecis]MCL6424309.1 cysteine hydrolase [Brachybacterium equifaecis]